MDAIATPSLFAQGTCRSPISISSISKRKKKKRIKKKQQKYTLQLGLLVEEKRIGQEEQRWQGKGGTAENHWNGRHWEKKNPNEKIFIPISPFLQLPVAPISLSLFSVWLLLLLTLQPWEDGPFLYYNTSLPSCPTSNSICQCAPMLLRIHITGC